MSRWGEPDGAVAYRVFAVLWAVALLYDGAVRTMTRDPHNLLVTVAALAVLHRPRATWRLALLCGAWVLLVLDTPVRKLMIHWYFDGAVSLAVLLAWVHVAVRDGVRDVQPAAFLAALRPAVMLIGISALTYAGFAKLNTAFLDPELSCGAVLYLIQKEHMPLLPGGDVALLGAIWGTVLCEIGGPLLLLFRRTRPVALVLLGGFFFFIGLNPVNHLYEFAAPVLTCCLLALGEGPIAAAWRRVADGPGRWVGGLLRPLGAPALVAALAGFAWLAVAGDSKGTRPLRQEFARWTWLIGEPAVIGALLWATIRMPWVEQPRFRVLASGGPRWLLVLPLLFVLHEATPYAGLRHRTTFTMAANLRTVDGFSNHVLVRSAPDLYWNRRVEVLASDNDEYLQKQARRRTIMSFLSFADHMARNPDSHARIAVRGVEEEIPRAADDARFSRRPPLAELLRFRPDGRGERLGCSHRRKLDKLRRSKKKKK